MNKVVMSIVFAGLLLLSNNSVLANEKDKAKAEGYVNKSLETLVNFADDPELSWFRNHIQNAKGIVIIPEEVQAAVLVGGSGGSGVLLRHHEDNSWSYPSFVGMGSASVGFQAGAKKAEVVLLVMTEKGMNTLLSTKAQLGADASVAAGPIGIGAKVATADVLQFARSKGVFAGLSVDGAIISPRNKLNEAYYGQPTNPLDILVNGTAKNVQADPLREKLAGFKTTDADSDGVSDQDDQCPDTPQGAQVDDAGCWSFQGAVLFDLNSTTIKAEAMPMFDNAVEVLSNNPDINVEIAGYTDNTGNAEYNLTLSEKRAQAVKDYLVGKGIAASRLTVKGYGEADPVSSNDTAEGQAKNRRVVLRKSSM